MSAFKELSGRERSYLTDTEAERAPLVGDGGFSNHIGNLLLGDAMEQAVGDKLAMAEEAHKAAAGKANGPRTEEDDAEKNSDEEEQERRAEEDCEADDDFLALRRKRMDALRAKMKKREEWKTKGHGEYSEITEEEFLPTVTKSDLAVVHFYHADFERCKFLDMRLAELAKKCLSCRMVKLNAEKAPFFVHKLSVQTLPTTVFFSNGVAVGRMVGFEGMGGTGETFALETLWTSMYEVGMVEEEPENDEPDNIDRE